MIFWLEAKLPVRIAPREREYQGYAPEDATQQ
jgi:hypothetical protein